MEDHSHLTDREATVSQVTALLKNFELHNHGIRRPTNLSIRPVSDGESFVEIAGVWFLIVDNGGELTVERLNSDELPRNVPLTEWDSPLNALTVAMRTAAVLRGEDMDFESNMSNEDQALLLAA